MSMHEFEDLVEQSIRLLATAERPIEELRSCYATLYDFQNAWDTGYTHFRVIDLLLAAHFVYRIPFADYPQRAEGVLVKDGWIELPGHSQGTYCKAHLLYIDAGSPAWKCLLEAGRLSGLDAIAPSKLDLFELALDVCLLAEQQGQRVLVGMWYRLLAAHAVVNELEGVQELGALIELRALVKRTGALAIGIVDRDFQRQSKRNPSRCQRSTVSGFTSKSASRHLGSTPASSVIRPRSRG